MKKNISSSRKKKVIPENNTSKKLKRLNKKADVVEEKVEVNVSSRKSSMKETKLQQVKIDIGEDSYQSEDEFIAQLQK